MGRIIGLGGVFLQFKGDKQALHDWYESHLGACLSEVGMNFIEGDQLALVTFKGTGEGTGINFRVEGIEVLVDQVLENGGSLVSREETPYGIFVNVKDPFGNQVELWQADKPAYVKMVQGEIKDYKS